MSRRVYFREIYFYIVCLAAIIIFIIGIVMAYDGIINFLKPTTYMTKSGAMSVYSQEQYKNLTAEQIEKLAEDEINTSIQNEKDRGFKNLLKGVLLIVVAIPLFSFHWRKAQQMWKLSLETKDTE